MSSINSQEQMIYRSLVGQIQLGFYQGCERFPSAQEIAHRYRVSYCPAQRALKTLEKDGLIRLCRGRETIILSRPYTDYLKSDVFYERVNALVDLNHALEILSPAICFQGMCNMDNISPIISAADRSSLGKSLYRLFEQSLRALGNRTLMNLYYDIGSFVESAYLDILYTLHEENEANLLLYHLHQSYLQSFQACRNGRYHSAKQQLRNTGTLFFDEIQRYLNQNSMNMKRDSQVVFYWEPHKGRTQYCDDIAIDLICKINQGRYPVGSLMPKGAMLADIYHVSAITIRRTIARLNKLGVVKTINGVGTRVMFSGDTTILYKLKALTMDENLRSFLEALQLLSVTCEAVISYTFPYCTKEALWAISQAAAIKEQNAAMIATISACLQAIVHCCPIAAIRKIYGEITLLMLKGSVLRLDHTGKEPIAGWNEISRAVLDSLATEDGARFAMVFRQLSEDNFLATKQSLQTVKVAGVEEVVAPIRQ